MSFEPTLTFWVVALSEALAVWIIWRLWRSAETAGVAKPISMIVGAGR
jgi:hypothetical protein